MDYSKLSDKQLQALHSGDFSQLSDDELVSLRGGESQPVETQTAPAEPWFEAGPVTIEKSPMEVDWLKAAKDEVTKEPDPSAKAALENPLMGAFSPAVAGGVSAATSAATSGIARGAVNAAERFATSPIPEKIANATDMVGKAKTLTGKLFGAVSDTLPDAGKKAASVAAEIAGRKATYSNPLTAIPQAVSDGSRVVQGAQKTVAWVLDNAPEKLGKFADVLRQAKSRGDAALATTSFLLQQSDPNFQAVMRQIDEERDQ